MKTRNSRAMAFPAVNLVLLGEFGAVGHELAALAEADRIIGGTRGRATRTFDRHLQPLTNPPAAAHPAQAVVLSQCREVSRSVRTCLNAPLAALNAVATDLSIAASSRVFVVTRDVACPRIACTMMIKAIATSRVAVRRSSSSANNPQQSWGFEGEPPEAVIKDSRTRDGTL
jgi:hypothetical protein